jgi:uncharacterized protein (DUF1697 family)
MKTFIALLRGVNVSGQKKMPMVEVRKMMTSIGFNDVQTYVQSGNIIFGSELNSTEEMEGLIHTAIENTFGYDVPVLVKSVSEIKDVIAKNPYNNENDLAQNRVYFVLLQDTPNAELVEAFEEMDFPNEKFMVSNSCVYLCCENGYGKAKLNNNLIERKLKVKATARNYRTMNKLLELAS